MYKPIRQRWPAPASSLATFVVSGLMHEWIIHAAFVYHRTNIPEGAYYKPSNIVLGTNFLFFAYGMVPVAIEKSLSKVDWIKSVGTKLPRPLKTLLVVMTSLPLAFWFAGPYFHGRLFLDYEGLVFTVIKME